ncbi:MAG TPA: flagellar basal-body MS-ring/collar protein FliF [Kofleriaceae bacterium]|nr:flagellar basal-body MS-ring/collar protein FliF [Kofleriaceae bacterium]
MAVLQQLKELWGRQAKSRKAIAIAAALGIAGVVAYSTLARRTEPWAPVSEGMSPDDAQSLLVVLEGRRVPARMHDGKVEVAPERLDEARAIAASSGLPHTGKGFEIFDASSLGQSSFAEQVNYRRALQGELGRSITALAQVESARVLVAFGKRSLAKDQEQPASASVALHLHAGQTLSVEQVRGVRQLVAASIENLKPEAVVIVDNHGNLLDGADPNSADRKADLERTVTARVRAMLERVVGIGKVSVVTTADVDDRKISETQELFDAEKPALRSESRTVEGADATQGIGGVAGTRGNLPGAPAAGPTGGSAGAGQRLQETKNYEVSRTVRQTTKPDVQLQKLHLAVVVDYKRGADGKPAPRTEQELAELTALARQSAGIDDARGDKIELRAIPFASDNDAIAAAVPPAASRLPLPLPVLAGGGAGALLLAGAIAFFLIRRRRRQAAEANPTLALPAPVGELERVLEARPSNEAGELPSPEAQTLLAGPTIRDRVLQAVRADIDRTAGVLTAWLAEPPRKGAK